LDTYEEERLTIAAAVLRRSDELYKNVVTQDGKEDRNEDDRQLTLNYRGSSLCGPASAETRLQPGDRMPNIPLRSTTGEALNLFDLIRMLPYYGFSPRGRKRDVRRGQVDPRGYTFAKVEVMKFLALDEHQRHQATLLDYERPRCCHCPFHCPPHGQVQQGHPYAERFKKRWWNR